jgi:hypothetical protein
MQNQSDFLILKNAAYLCIFVLTGKSGCDYTNLTLELLLIFSVNILKYKYFGSTLTQEHGKSIVRFCHHIFSQCITEVISFMPAAKL